MSKTKYIRSIVWLLLVATHSYAQAEYLGNRAGIFSADTGIQFYSRTLKANQKEENVSQWVFPLFVASRWLREDLHFSVSQTLSAAELEDHPGLSGFENTKFRVSYRLSADTLIFSGLSLPIAKADSDVETARTNALLYTEALQFGVIRIVEGTDFDIGFTYARPVGNLGLGFGVGYLRQGDYDVRSQEANVIRFEPGDVIGLGISGQFRSGLASLRGKILYSRYGEGTYGENRFESGDELTFLAAAIFRLDPLRLSVFLADTVKGTIVSEQEISVNNLNNPFRNRINAGITITYPLLNERLLLNTRAGLKSFFDGDGESDAQVAVLGGGFQFFITENLALDISTSLITGEMDARQTDISGHSLGLLAHYGF